MIINNRKKSAMHFFEIIIAKIMILIFFKPRQIGFINISLLTVVMIFMQFPRINYLILLQQTVSKITENKLLVIAKLVANTYIVQGIKSLILYITPKV